MGLSCFVGFLLLSASLFASSAESSVLYDVQRGQLTRAVDRYQQLKERGEVHDTELIEQIGLLILRQHFNSSNVDSQILALFGAAVSLNDKALDIAMEGTSAKDPRVQMISLGILGKSGSEESLHYIRRAATSPIPLIQLEAIHLLAGRKDQKAYGMIEAFMQKVPDELTPLFPQLLVLVNNNSAKALLKRLLHHPRPQVRIEAILSIVQAGRDDFLPSLRKLATHPDNGHIEAALYALGHFRDRGALERIQLLSSSSDPFIRLSALYALYRSGDDAARTFICNQALQGDPYAVYLLGEIAGSEPFLVLLMQSPSVPLRINAAYALLRLKDDRCASGLSEILVRDRRDLAFVKMQSPGHAFIAYRPIPSAQHNLENPAQHELSLRFREDVLEQLSSLGKRPFIQLAKHLFDEGQSELIPLLVKKLEETAYPEGIELLKSNSQRAGAPLIRHYCDLALYRLQEEGEYRMRLIAWMQEQQTTPTIGFRPLAYREVNQMEYDYRLTPHEQARLLIEIYETLAQEMSDTSIDYLLEALKVGHPSHRPIIASLLMRASL